MKDNIEQIEDAVYKPGKRSVVTGEKIKHKSVRRIKKEHKERSKEDRKEQKILNKKIEKMDRKFKKTQVTVESTTIVVNCVLIEFHGCLLLSNVCISPFPIIFKSNNLEHPVKISAIG